MVRSFSLYPKGHTLICRIWLSDRLSRLFAGKMYHRDDVQTARRWGSIPELSAGDVHHLSSGSLGLGILSNCNVSKRASRNFSVLYGLMAHALNRCSSMLYHLINLNPHKDITLHVSTNNPAMVRIASAVSFVGMYAISNSHVRIAPVQSLWV